MREAGGRAAAPNAIAEKRAYFGAVGRSNANPKKFTYGRAIRGGVRKRDGVLYNESYLDDGPLPPGFTRVAAYWVLAHHQDPSSWPVHERGESDGDVLKRTGTNAVLTIPPPRGGGPASNQFKYKIYNADENREE